MLNHIVLMGRLTRDPELRHTTSGSARGWNSLSSFQRLPCWILLSSLPQDYSIRLSSSREFSSLPQ